MRVLVLFMMLLGLSLMDKVVLAESDVTSTGFIIQEADGSPTGKARTVNVSNTTLTDNGGGSWTVTTGGGGGTPGNPTSSVQFNSAGSFAGDTSMIWDNTSNTISISRDASQTGYAVRISGDLSSQGVLGNISHDGSAYFDSLQLNTSLSVAEGGTGVSTITDGGVLIGKGTGAIENTGLLAKGTIIIGDGTTNPTTLTVGPAGILSGSSMRYQQNIASDIIQ